MSQFKLLLLVADNDGSRVGDLALALHVTPPTVTASLDRLVAHGLVRREDHSVDRRLVIARLTPEGRDLLRRLNLQHREDIADCLSELSETEVESLYSGLMALYRVWNARHASTTRSGLEQADLSAL